MPNYLERTDLFGDMPQREVEQALTDSGGDLEENWLAVCASVEDAINGLLAPRYSYPFPEPVGPVVKTAARTLTLETLYRRRGLYGEGNPVWKDAEGIRTHLRQIGAGKILLDVLGPVPAALPAGTAAAAEGPPLRSASACGDRIPI